MNVGSKDPPNYNNCTECKNQVCSLCGFSPPDSAVRKQPLFLVLFFYLLAILNKSQLVSYPHIVIMVYSRSILTCIC